MSGRDTRRATEAREAPDALVAPQDGLPERERPRRPVGVELAAALMIVSGVISVLTSIEAASTLAAKGEDPEGLVLLVLAIGVGSVVLGVLVRTGRAWLVAVNVAAVAGFLELTSGTVQGWLFGGLDVAVVLLLMRERPWFYWNRPDPDDEDGFEDD